MRMVCLQTDTRVVSLVECNGHRKSEALEVLAVIKAQGRNIKVKSYDNKCY